MGAAVAVVAAVLAGTGALMALLVVRIRQGGPQRPDSLWGGFGVRTPSTLASDDSWHAGHRAALPWIKATAAVSIVGAAGALVALLVADDLTAFGVGMVAVTGMIGLSVVTILSPAPQRRAPGPDGADERAGVR